MSVSNAYWTGDYGSTIDRIRGEPNIVEQLVRSLADPNIITMEATIWVGSIEGSREAEAQVCSLIKDQKLIKDKVFIQL